MNYKYDENIHIDERRDVVFCWLRNDETRDYIRVEATRGFIADKWKIECGNKEALISEFKKRRDAYLDKASKTIDTEGELKIYVMH